MGPPYVALLLLAALKKHLSAQDLAQAARLAEIVRRQCRVD